MSDNSATHKDLFWMMCRQQIGAGMSRNVYSSDVLKDSVIKVEETRGHFQNILEWEIWNRMQSTVHAKWFAPCEWISPNGLLLVMAKTTPLEKDKYPKELPAFFTDIKYANFGLYKGNFVCHDYGFTLLMERGMSKRMQKVEWY